MQKNIWKQKGGEFTDYEVGELASSLNVSRGFARLLLCRGIDGRESFDLFLSEAKGNDDPFSLPDMEEGVKRIKKAVESGEKILIYGDYDADGVTSVALLYLFLKERGGNVEYHIPDRFKEGYGMSSEVIDGLAERNIDLIITVDTGISAEKEIARAAAYGIDTVVTDHHECLGGVPTSAVAAINPTRDDAVGCFKGYSGVGVAFMTAMAYLSLSMPLSKARETVYSSYSDIAAIGTVADVMPIRGENRAIVKRGLEKISKGDCNMGITALLLAAKGKGSRVNSTTLGFILGPRINAAGRLCHAGLAEELFLNEDYDTCCKIASELCGYNLKRQTIEAEIMEEACEIIECEGKDKLPLIVLGSEYWNHGVIGIVASRLVEKYRRPVILFCIENEHAKGSGRSIEGFDLAKAIDSCAHLIVKYGGHEQAAGLTVAKENLTEFEKEINRYAESFDLKHEGAVINIDACLTAYDLTLPFAKEIEMLEPFGQDNPEPLFMLRGARISDMRILSGGKHTKFTLTSDKLSFEGLMFGINAEERGVDTGETIDVVFTLEINEYVGVRKVFLNIKDYRLSGETAELMEYFHKCWNDFLLDPIKEGKGILPNRKDCVPVYRRIAALAGDGWVTVGMKRLLPMGCSRTDYLKTRLIIEIFVENKLIEIEEIDCHTMKLRVNSKAEKTDIKESPIYKKIANG